MGLISLIFLAIGVSMDTFAVSLCKGMSAKNYKKSAIVCAIWFSVFQIIMLTTGFLLCSIFDEYVDMFDHWIAFALFVINGVKMIKDSGESTDDSSCSELSFKHMFTLSFATSIDALAVGISFALLNANIFVAALVIFIGTFAFTIIGTIIGQKFGKKTSITQIIGGLLILLIAAKIVVGAYYKLPF